MPRSRYRESRILVRRLCRLPGQREEFTRNVERLRSHFEQFNVDVSELCQWWMTLRKRYGTPGRPSSFGVLGDFLLEPRIEGIDLTEQDADAWRLRVFDDVASFCPLDSPGQMSLPDALRKAMQLAAGASWTPTTRRLFDRMRNYHPTQRFVLLKAAAEWIVARYQKPLQWWEEQRPKFERARAAWEKKHPALTPQVRDQFTIIFQNLVDPGQDQRPGIRRKNPRICRWDRLKTGQDNCAYGEKGHGPLCWKYAEFVKACKDLKAFDAQHGRDPRRKKLIDAVKELFQWARNSNTGYRFDEKHFWENAEQYLQARIRIQETGRRGGNGSPHQLALESLFRDPRIGPQEAQRRRERFKREWKAYLEALEIGDQVVIEQKRLPHCSKIGETGDKSQCEFNRHTELCNRYKTALQSLDEPTRSLEGEYREWRALGYLGGPRKPCFRYPSSRRLPIPKIFGKEYFELDFQRSCVSLRLDSGGQEDWVSFAFAPWPKQYHPRWQNVTVTSVHVNFVGNRVRLGLRFEVPHKQSRFSSTQDELDLLRKKFRFPDEEGDYLRETQQLLCNTFQGQFRQQARILSVDLGRNGAAATVYEGCKHIADIPLPINKIDYCYPLSSRIDPKQLDPKPLYQPDGPSSRRSKTDDDDEVDSRGLCIEHIARHLAALSQGASQLTQYRQQPTVVLQSNDYRRLQGHIKWMIRDWVRHNASCIIAAAEQYECDLILFENLRETRVPGYDVLNPKAAHEKRQLAVLSFGRIRQKVTEKAVERGMRVVTVPEFRSSRVCSQCGHDQTLDRSQQRKWKKNKEQGKFRCLCAAPATGNSSGSKRDQAAPAGEQEQQPAAQQSNCQCRLELHSDVNAARVLARILLGEIPLPPREPAKG